MINGVHFHNSNIFQQLECWEKLWFSCLFNKEILYLIFHFLGGGQEIQSPVIPEMVIIESWSLTNMFAQTHCEYRYSHMIDYYNREHE